MPFAGVSFIGDGTPASRSASAVTAVTHSGYHLVVVDGYSRTKNTPNGCWLASRPFSVGGYRWRIAYYPNGRRSEDADYISFGLALEASCLDKECDDQCIDKENPVMVSHLFTFVNEGRSDKKKTLIMLSGTRPVETHCLIFGRGLVDDRFAKREFLEQSEYLKDDRFAIRCDIVFTSRRTNHFGDVPSIVVPRSDMHEHFGDLLRSKDGADVVFEIGGETFAAHRCVLAARSAVFRTQFFGAANAVAELQEEEDTEKDEAEGKGDRDDEVIEIEEDEIIQAEEGEGIYLEEDDKDYEVEEEEEEDDDDDDVMEQDEGEAGQGDDEDMFGAEKDEMFEEEKDSDEKKRLVWQALLVAADRYELERLTLICEKKLSTIINMSTVAKG
ncbi:hypothetical protein ACP4OV_004676 [Aristida adscensionis]